MIKIFGYLSSLVLALWLFAQLTLKAEKTALASATTLFIKHRMLDFIDNQEKVFSNPKAALFFGGSEIECCLNPKLVDRVLKKNGMDLKAINIGLRNVELEVYVALVYQMSRVLQSKDQRLDTVFVKVPYAKLTGRYRRHSRPSVVVADQMAAVLSYEDLWQGRAYFRELIPEILTYKLLFFGASPYLYKILFNNILGSVSLNSTDPLAEEFQALWLRAEFLEMPLWNLQAGGAYNFNLPSSQIQFDQVNERKKTTELRKWSVQRFSHCCDVSSLRPSPSQIKIFADMVGLLKTVSKKVVLYHIPEPPEYLVAKTDAYQDNLSEIFSQIESHTDISVMEVEASLEEQDFLDFLHLSDSGQIKFYDQLFKQLKRNDMQDAH